MAATKKWRKRPPPWVRELIGPPCDARVPHAARRPLGARGLTSVSPKSWWPSTAFGGPSRAEVVGAHHHAPLRLSTACLFATRKSGGLPINRSRESSVHDTRSECIQQWTNSSRQGRGGAPTRCSATQARLGMTWFFGECPHGAKLEQAPSPVGGGVRGGVPEWSCRVSSSVARKCGRRSAEAANEGR